MTPPKLDRPTTFAECVLLAYDTPDFVAEFDRLRGSNLSCQGTALELMIDASSGRRTSDLVAFVEFVKDYVWDRLPPQVRTGEPTS
jgi:hypothetical protein